MDTNDLIANRLIHVGVITVIALVALILTAELPTVQRVFLAVSPIATWVIGKYYERAIIVQAELVDLDTVRELEREKARFLF